MPDQPVENKRRKTYRIAKKETVAAEPNEHDSGGEQPEHAVAVAAAAAAAVEGVNAAFDDLGLDDLIPDIEDYIEGALSNEASQGSAALPPVIKFRKNWSLSVTDLSSQLWCEKQTELTLITGRKRVTKEMEEGIERHEQLELEDHEIVEVAVETNEDYLGIKLLNSINLIEQLLETGKCRELWLFGNIEGYVLRGIIDQLELVPAAGHRGERRVLISDTKTRKQRRKPSVPQMQGASLQVQAYCLMLESMRRGAEPFDGLYKAFECESSAPFRSEELVAEGCLAQLEQRFRSTFSRLPEVATTMQLSYEHEGEVFDTSDIPLQEQSTLYTIRYLFSFWDGAREAEPVSKSESWKCKLCEFRDECELSPLYKPPAPKATTPGSQTRLDSFFKASPRPRPRA